MVTSKGLQTVIKSCKEWQDEVSRRLLPILEESSETPQMHFHFKCHSTYTDSKMIALAVKRPSESTSRDELKPKRISREEASNFSWDEHCFICGEEENRKRINLSRKSTCAYPKFTKKY